MAFFPLLLLTLFSLVYWSFLCWLGQWEKHDGRNCVHFANRALGIAVLTGLQIGVLSLFPFFFGPSEELDHLQTAGYNLSIWKVTLWSEPRCTLTLMEEFSVAPLVNFGKIHWRMKDTRSPESAVILPVNSTHVAVLINRFSHYQRTVVDLTVKNLPIKVETIPAER